VPYAKVDNTRLFYRLEGTPGRPVLVLSHSIGTDNNMWDEQVEILLPYFQILRYDTRGHGASDGPAGEYSMELLARDVIAVADAAGVEKFAYCGLSLGGMLGQRLAADYPDRITALILANTTPYHPPASNWETRRRTVLEKGMAAIVDMAMQRFFSARTLAEHNPRAESIRRVILGTDPTGYAGCCAAVRDMDNRPLLGKLRMPTLVIVGDQDASTPWEGHGDVLARDIAGAKVVRLPTAHLSNIEKPRSFSMAVLEFVRPSGEKPNDSIDAGYGVRRAILGDAHVDSSIARANDFTRDFQEFITRYAWGGIWTRPGLSRRVRRLLVLAIAASLGRWEEFTLHLRAGLQSDLEACDLKETLLQTAIYAGVPAANTAFHIANEEMQKSSASATPK